MLTTKAIFGASWMVSSRLTGRMIDFATVLILARVLSPADFGLTALAASLIAILDTALEIPLSQALIRLEKVEKPHLDTAFTLALLRGCALSTLLLAAAYPFSLLYHDPRLPAVLCVLAIGPIARSLYSPAMVKFSRNISFRQAFTADVTGKIVAACCSMFLAYHGGKYWAIAANSVISPLTAALLSYVLAPYRPALNFSRFSDFSSFIGWLSFAQLLTAASWQVDRGVLGYFVSKATLGRYTMASDFAQLPTQTLVGPALQPVMAAYAQIRGDQGRLARAYVRATQYAVTVAAPAGVGMALSADLVVKVVLGRQWLESVSYLKCLAVLAVFQALYQPFYGLVMALNRPRIIFRMSLLDICCKVILVALGYSLYRMQGVLAARAAVSVIIFVVVLLTARRITGARALTQLISLWRVAVSTAVMSACVTLALRELAAVSLGDPIKLGLVVVVGAISYVGTLFGLGFRLPTSASGKTAASEAVSSA